MKHPSFATALVVFSVVSGAALAADDMFDSNGVKIRYVTEGKGQAVVLIHGWMGDSSMWGRDSSGNTKLKGVDGFQLVAIDCRGHGKSDKPHDVDRYGPEMAADVVRLLDHLKIDKAHLIGYSSGAFIAGRVAATHPERVRSIVYGGQAPLIAGLKTKSSDSSKPSEVEIFARAVDEGKDLSAYIIAVTPSDRKKPTEEQARAIAAFLYNGKDVKAFAAAGRSFGKLQVTEEQLKKCQAPILFIHGGNESDQVKDRVAAVRKLLGRGEVKIIEGGDHVTTIIKPEFASALLAFLKAAAKDKDRPDELSRLEGVWTIAEATHAGAVVEKSSEPEEFEFKGNQLIARKGNRAPIVMTLRLDLSTDPKLIDWTTDAKGEFKDATGFAEGIYKLEGDTLTVCYHVRDNRFAKGNRPTEFKSAEGSDAMLLVLKRAKK